MLHWKIGCSGYHYDEWNRIFYPENLPARNRFDYYSSHFNTLELNVTFYRFPKLDFLQSWYSRSPENFYFTVKAPRLITHFKRLNEAQDALSKFYNNVQQGLRQKLGCVLFQFPSSFVFEGHRLERIINLLDHRVKNVVEFRHASWWNENVFETFSRNNIAFSGMSHPQLPNDVIKTTETVYYRFHGVPHLYISKYDSHQLEEVTQRIQNFNNVSDAFIYFNNTAEGAAIANARQFQEICQEVSRAH
jgi:uncharacterized protein YecE (DUF72 family)